MKVEAHDKAWAENMKMGSFLSVAQGSDQPPVFLELTYNGGKAGDKPIALVGQFPHASILTLARVDPVFLPWCNNGVLFRKGNHIRQWRHLAQGTIIHYG